MSKHNKSEHANIKPALQEDNSHKSVAKNTPKPKVNDEQHYVPVKRHIATPTPTPIKKSVVVKKYYIKVGTFKDPSNAIKLVGDKGLHYKKIETDSGATRV